MSLFDKLVDAARNGSVFFNSNKRYLSDKALASVLKEASIERKFK